ncbi:hypothetical protein TNCV_3082721 [Trichonephila clavipes]|nr:hypothetical protein TNCV_3082721 [Trichonephila clavipes]
MYDFLNAMFRSCVIQQKNVRNEYYSLTHIKKNCVLGRAARESSCGDTEGRVADGTGMITPSSRILTRASKIFNATPKVFDRRYRPLWRSGAPMFTVNTSQSETEEVSRK